MTSKQSLNISTIAAVVGILFPSGAMLIFTGEVKGNVEDNELLSKSNEEKNITQQEQINKHDVQIGQLTVKVGALVESLENEREDRKEESQYVRLLLERIDRRLTEHGK